MYAYIYTCEHISIMQTVPLAKISQKSACYQIYEVK